MLVTLLIAALLRASSTVASSSSFLSSHGAEDPAVSVLLEIAPTSSTCDLAPFPSECATAAQAAPFIFGAMANYSITPLEMSALLSLIAFETNEFKYNINHYPGRAGQGTRNMQIAEFNLQYALSIPELE